MDRHILGTFRNEEDAVSQIEKLINEEGYSPGELMLVMDKENEYDQRIETFNTVKVNKVEVEEESIWEKIKEAFSFGTYDSEENASTLEQYGVPHDRADHYMDALRDGEIVLLADTDAPRQTSLSEVNEEIILEKERENNMTDKNNHPADEVVSEEAEAVTDKKPSDVETSENENIDESVDASQVSDTRKDDEGNNESSSEKKENTQGVGSKEEPDLTGQEDTVNKEESNHGYGNTVAKGVVSPEAVSPLNTDEKDQKEPDEDTEAPESEANYSDEMEEQGKTSLDDNN